MNNQLSIYKILHLVRYDFKSNITSWLYLIALQLISFLALGFFMDALEYGVAYGQNYFDPMQASQMVNIAGLVATFVLEVIKKLVGWFLLFLTFQNGLDLAFESSMRGFSFDKETILPVSGLLLCLVSPWVPLIIALDSITSSAAFFTLLGCLGVLVFYLWIRLQFSILHALEYNTSVIRSITSSMGMTKGRILWLTGVFAIQAVVGALLVGAILGADSVLLYFQDSLEAETFTILFMVISCLAAVILLLYFVWFSLIQVHMYRELVDPYVENISCKTCDSCIKHENKTSAK